MIAIAQRIPFASKTIPELQKFIKRREVHYIESPHPNNSFFEALSYLSMPESKVNRYRSRDRVVEGIQLMIQHYSLSGKSAKCRDVQEFIHDYKGFDLAAEVPVVGFNSTHFEMILILPFLTNKDWHIVQGGYLDDFSHIKREEVRHKIINVKIQILDIGIFMIKKSLNEAVNSFNEGPKQDMKGIFSNIAFNYDNYNKILLKSEPFVQTDFLNLLKEETLSDKDYQVYLEDNKNFKT
ncbi:MAG: hypothetical protein EZS28_002628 [Streblomastix strix]|uniref:Uncharacterized protein n=1 Tax=Streblomastix strix TaxID=222440 RepID=A0A5J4X3K2_9EUKA|nr:MAG: hypothetical protein EZS28_002628 [Streblomastix strix]